MLNKRVAVRSAFVASVAILAGATLASRLTGLRVVYFADADWQVPAYRTVARSITTETITQDAPIPPEQPFSASWSGYLYVHRTGDYAFSVFSEGAGSLDVDRATADDKRTAPALIPVREPVHLDAGAHAILISYRHTSGRYGLDVHMARLGEPLALLRATDLSREPHRPIVYLAVDGLERAAIVTIAAWLVLGIAWMTRRVPKWTAACLVATTIAFVLAVAYDRPAWIRGPAPYPIEWQWPYHAGAAVIGLGPALLAAVAVLALMAFLVFSPVPRRARARIGLVCAPFAAVAFQLAMLHFQSGGTVVTLVRDTMSPGITSYFNVALGFPTDTKAFLSSYVSVQPTFPLHARTHPPGPVLYYRLFVQAFQSAPGIGTRVVNGLQWAGVHRTRLLSAGDSLPPPLAAAALAGALGTVLCASFTCWPVARMVELGGTDALTAAQIAVLWAFCPAAVFFSPMFDQILMFLIATCGAFACGAIQSRRTTTFLACGLASGITAGLALFSSFSAVPMLAAAGILTIALTRVDRSAWPRLAGLALLLTLGVCAVFAEPTLAGYNHIAAARFGLGVHLDHYTAARNGWLWLRFNLLDFSVFLGWPMVVWGVVRLVRGYKAHAASLFRPHVLWTMTAIVVAIDLADITRGEVGRLWMPLTPLLYVAVAIAATEPLVRQRPASSAEDGKANGAERLLVAGLLAVTTICLGLYWYS